MTSRRALLSLALAILVGSTATYGCGANDPGDPVEPTRELAAPAPRDSRADVYCAPQQTETERCDVLLKVSDEVSLDEAAEWLFRVSNRLRERPDVFEYEGKRFKYGSIAVFLRTTDGDHAPAGWLCAEDNALSEDAAARRMRAREPGAPEAISSLTQARASGCKLAIFPTRHETASRDQ